MLNQINVDKAVLTVKSLAGRANSLAHAELEAGYAGFDPDYSNHDAIQEAIGSAFLILINLAQTLELKELCKMIVEAHASAKKIGLAKTEQFEDQSAWSAWSDMVVQFADSMATVFGSESTISGAVETDLITLLKNTQAAVTDKRCFEPPQNEDEVHNRIESILRCIYPDLQRKPPIAKPVVNFVPDSGIPSIGTLIEYKFISDASQAGPIANEILADITGYAKSVWKKIVFVIYETHRFKTRQEWDALLRKSGITDNIDIVLLHGEQPKKKRGRPKKKSGN